MVNDSATVPGIDRDRVTAWMASRLSDLVPPLEFSRLTGGHSNLTYRCDDRAGAVYVLRRPPLGHVLESAHDMVREHRIVSALAGSAVPVAPTHGLCEDVGVNGAPFYLMSYVDGVVLKEPAEARSMPMAERALLSEQVIGILAELHSVDPDAVGLGNLARKDAYLARQLKRWTRQWEATRTHDVPEMEEAIRLLGERMPEQIGCAIVHGDYRLGNLLVRDGRVQAVLDWELCTLGDPLADLAFLLNTWAEPGDPNGDRQLTGTGGFWSRDEISARYAEATGRDLDHIDYYRAFSHWRLAAINQGVYKRYIEGALGDHSSASQRVDLDDKKASVGRRANMALDLLTG